MGGGWRRAGLIGYKLYPLKGSSATLPLTGAKPKISYLEYFNIISRFTLRNWVGILGLGLIG